MNHTKNWWGQKKYPKVNISNYYALIYALLEKVYYRSLTQVCNFQFDFIHRIQNFENMKKVYNVQDI